LRDASLKNTKIFGFLLLLLIVGLSFNLTMLGNAQDEEDDRLTLTVEYKNKVYDGDSDKWNFTIANNNVPVDSTGKTRFFFKIYLDDSLLWNEYENTDYHTWNLSVGSTETRSYAFPEWSGPAKHKIRIELYWYKDGTPTRVAQRTRVVHVAKVFIANWTPTIQAVQRGTDKPSNLSISLANGGNDDMFNTSISVRDVDKLEITPLSQYLGTIGAGENRTAIFSVMARDTEEPAHTQNPTFEIRYNDFRGLTHVEEFRATVEVIANPVVRNLLNILSGVAIATAASLLIVFVALIKRSKGAKIHRHPPIVKHLKPTTLITKLSFKPCSLIKASPRI